MWIYVDAFIKKQKQKTKYRPSQIYRELKIRNIVIRF